MTQVSRLALLNQTLKVEVEDLFQSRFIALYLQMLYFYALYQRNNFNDNYVLITMKVRTCPHCGYKYSRIDYVKKLFLKTIWSKWDCPKCKQEITFDNIRRFILALVFGVWTFLLSMTTSYFTFVYIKVPLYFTALILGSIFIFSFDTFTKTINRD